MDIGIKFKPIKTLLIISLVLHIISLCAVALVYIYQAPLIAVLFINDAGFNDIFISPHLLTLIPIAIFFTLHCALTYGFLKGMQGETLPFNSLRTLSVLTIILTIFVIPIGNWILVSRESFLMSQVGTDTFDVFIQTRILVNHAFTLRSLALSILLIAAAMAFYYTHLKKHEPPTPPEGNDAPWSF